MKTTLTRDESSTWYAPFVPPGMKLSGEMTFFLLALIAALCYAFGFVIRLVSALDALYIWENGKRILNESARMMPFYEVFGGAWNGYFLCAGCMLLYSIAHPLSYNAGSHASYLMRRLPDRISYLRYTWALTLAEIVVCLLLAVLCLFLSLAIYHLSTPDACAVPNQLADFIAHILP